VAELARIWPRIPAELSCPFSGEFDYHDQPMTKHLILGTAGHIDHGKTTLIRALTGVNTDRLPEEKKRGITIDLGFAELTVGDYRLGVVDVPGHERFVRNMLAGATGMDIALLVVAADDSVKPQTREHLEILRLLDLPAGVIALTKCEAFDNDWLELVAAEVRELTEGTFLETAPIIPTSATEGIGLEELKAALLGAADTASLVASAKRSGPFRMPIDRAFSVEGHGAVVTGSIARGVAKVGDTLQIEPGGIEVRVRGLHNHDQEVEEVHSGQRAAINLAGVRKADIVRGQELAAPGHLQPGNLITAQISLLASATRPLKNRDRVRIHVGAAEVLGTVRLLDVDRLEVGQTALAQFYLGEPTVTVWSQPLVLRSESPVNTIGGGIVLDPVAEKIRLLDDVTKQHLQKLSSEDEVDRASAALYLAAFRGWKAEDLNHSAGVTDVAGAALELKERGELLEIRLSPSRTQFVHRDQLDLLCDRIAAALDKLHDKHPLRSSLDRGQLVQGFRYVGDEAIVQAALKKMEKEKQIRLSERGVALQGKGPKLSQNERKLLHWLIDRFREAGFEAPTPDQCVKEAAKNKDSVPALLALAVADGDLVEVAAKSYLHVATDNAMQEKIREHLQSQGTGCTLSEIRELLGSSRKYVVPYCEYLDKIGFTKREGDLRVLAE